MRYFPSTLETLPLTKCSPSTFVFPGSLSCSSLYRPLPLLPPWLLLLPLLLLVPLLSSGLSLPFCLTPGRLLPFIPRERLSSEFRDSFHLSSRAIRGCVFPSSPRATATARARETICLSRLLVSPPMFAEHPLLSPRWGTSEKFLACHTSSSLPGHAVIHDL